MRQLILIRYGEIYLKGLNRPYFLHALVDRVKQAAKPFGGKVWLHDARLFVSDMTDMEGCMTAVSRVFGVHSLCPAIEMDKADFTAICEQAASMMEGITGTFKVDARRSDKRYPMTSPQINMEMGGEGTKLYTTAGTRFKKLCLENKLHLLDASVRHLGTDKNYQVLGNIYEYLKDKIEFHFNSDVGDLAVNEDGTYDVECGGEHYTCRNCIVSVGRSGSKWIEKVCSELDIETYSNRVDIGVRVELPAVVFADLTSELYESKIVYRTEKFEDKVRTFCMNPNGYVVNENTNGIVTVNGHSFDAPELQSENTNFALLVAKHFSEPFKDSNGYGESIARLSNMLGGGVIVQRFGDLIRGRRTNDSRIAESTVRPTLNATPGDLSLVLPKRILDGIIEMIYALDKIAPGTANDDTLLYGVEVKFYNMEVAIDDRLETRYPGLFVIGDGSGVTHSLSHASASGVFVAREIAGSCD